MNKEIEQKIKDADLVLIGIGTEFETKKYSVDKRAKEALHKLLEILTGKNYFLLTTCTNDVLQDIGFKTDRMVAPCGTLKKKQCECCENSLTDLTKEDIFLLEKAIVQNETPYLSACPICGQPMVLNNVYSKKYDENGYLENWTIYKKWLQGTINKRLCILELGVDLAFPSVIRWPFEKVAFYNQKADFIRVNERLFHMSEELKDKGISIAQNSVDWLCEKDI